jgi:hypothetical protein
MFKTFKLEEYLARYEFSSPYLMCSSDPQSMLAKDVLALASKEEKEIWDKLDLSYTTPEGHPLLREVIAKQLYPGLGETPRGKPRGISLLQASLPPIFVPLLFYITSNYFLV